MQTRRRFLTAAGGLTAATVLAPGAIPLASARSRPPLLRGGSFPEGVLSGDPRPGGITLWTRVGGVERRGSVRLEVARDRGFRRVVASQQVTVDPRGGHAAKARVTGLDPHERYYYRWETADRESPVGRFQTALPRGSNQTVRFAFFSCQEYTFGYYNAHRLLAREDVDFVVNLGDYIYSDVALDPPNGVRSGDFTISQGFSAVTREEYRERYSRYRSDPALRAVHARFPMISTWDDHEVQDDYAGGDPEGGAVTGDPYTRERRDVAYAAFFESMPTFSVGRGTRLYHRAGFGRTMDLFVLDERQYRAAQPCQGEGQAYGVPCEELFEPRDFLGRQQQAFLRSGLRRSRAAWKVIANQVMIMPLKLDESRYDSFDPWQGYPVEREALLRVVRGVPDVVFVTGDYHAFVAGDVNTADGTTVASEFAGGSITAPTEPEINAIISRPGYGTPDNPQMPESELAARRAASPWIAELDYLHHGYALCEVSRRRFKATMKKLETVRQPSTALFEQRSFTLERGQRGLEA